MGKMPHQATGRSNPLSARTAAIVLATLGTLYAGVGCFFDRSGLPAAGGDGQVSQDVAPLTDGGPPLDSTPPTDGPPEPTCGDGMRNGEEPCEGADLGGQDCADLGFYSGQLACDAACMLDMSLCYDVPADWYDPGWTFRKAILIDHAQVTGGFAQFPVLVATTDGDLASDAQSTGNDLLFTRSDGVTRLRHEIEAYDASNGRLVAWVAVQDLSSTADTLIYLYYGNPGVGPQQNPPLVWDAGYQGVWHLSEPAPDETQGAQHTDSTVHGHHGTQAGNGASPGQIGGAQAFDGVDDEIVVSQPDSFQLGNADCTISAWIKTGSGDAMGIVVKSPPGSHVPNDKLFGVNHGGDELGHDEGWVGYIGSTAVVTNDQWHHVAWVQVRDAQNTAEEWRLYVDGVLQSSVTANTGPDVSGHTLRIGSHCVGSYFNNHWSGSIDEVRISSTSRSDMWIATSYANQSAPHTFLTIAPAEQLGP